MSNQKSNSNLKPQLIESNYPLGIDNYSEWYIRISEGQNKTDEFKEVNKFISDFCLNNNFITIYKLRRYTISLCNNIR